MAKNITFSTRELLLAAILFVAAAAIITGITTTTTEVRALSSLKAGQTNNIANIKSNYDITFKTDTAADIAKIDVTFPAGTDISNRVIVEASGIGSGSTTSSGNTITYNVDRNQIKSISSGTTIRLEFGHIINPDLKVASDSSNILTVRVTTKKSDGTVIEGPTTSSTYKIKDVLGSNIAPFSINGATRLIADSVIGSRIADNTITGDKIAGTSKLVFIKCTVSAKASVPPASGIGALCVNSSVADGDAVVVTRNNFDATGCFDLRNGEAVTGKVALFFANECPTDQTLGKVTVSAVVFKPS